MPRHSRADGSPSPDFTHLTYREIDSRLRGSDEGQKPFSLLPSSWPERGGVEENRCVAKAKCTVATIPQFLVLSRQSVRVIRLIPRKSAWLGWATCMLLKMLEMRPHPVVRLLVSAHLATAFRTTHQLASAIERVCYPNGHPNAAFFDLAFVYSFCHGVLSSQSLVCLHT
jgi:hypothetical protein